MQQMHPMAVAGRLERLAAAFEISVGELFKGLWRRFSADMFGSDPLACAALVGQLQHLGPGPDFQIYTPVSEWCPFAGVEKS
jgi:hypothetical protein